MLEVGAAERVAVQVAIDRVRSALLHPVELGEALVELVVAHAIDVQAHQVHRLDGWFVVKESGDERRPSDQVAGGNEHGVLDLGPCGADVGGQVIGAPDPAEGIGRSGDVPVEVVDGQDAKLYLIALSRAAVGKRRRRQEKRDPNELCYCSHYIPCFH